MKILVILILFLAPSFADAGTVITDAVISKVATSNDGWSDNFYLGLSGGTGLCANQGWVIFKKERAINQEAFNRLYSTALMAFASGKKVRIYSYQNDACDEVTFIEVYN